MKKRIAAIFFSVVLLFSPFGMRSRALSSQPCRHVSTEEKVVALTFDDGPHPRYTSEILDLLAMYDAKATFFVIGKNVELYGDLVVRAAAEGHEIGNHTYAHPKLSELSHAALEREILKNEAMIEELVGTAPLLFRPPEGYCSPDVSHAALKNGISIILWNVDTRDWSGNSSESITSHVLANAVPGSIILFHDYIAHNSPTPAALKEILPRLDAAGFRFVTVSELLTFVKTPVVNPGD